MLQSVGALAKSAMGVRGVYIMIIIPAVLWFSANYAAVGVSSAVAEYYTTLALIGLVLLALYGGPNDLDWKAASPIKFLFGDGEEAAPNWLTVLTTATVAFTGTFAAVWGIKFAQGALPQQVRPEAIWPNVFTQVFLVALVETIVFQAILPIVILKKLREAGVSGSALWAAPLLISQTSFALMHVVAFAGDVQGLLTVGILGVGWYVGAQKFGIAFSWMSHAAYNLVVTGTLTLMASGVV